MNVSPSKPIPVSYAVLPYDTTTYFVQSVLRDTATGAVLQKINLTQDPTALYRYSGSFTPVSDPSGLGRYIDIVTIPYTDAAHTTPSQNYGVQQDNYVALQMLSPNVGVGGAGGGDIDYKILADMVARRITEPEKKKKKKEVTVKPVEVDYDRIERFMATSMDSLRTELDAKIAPVSSSVEGMKDTPRKYIENATEAILGRVGTLEQRVDSVVSEITKNTDKMKKDITASLDTIGETIDSLKEEVSDNMLKEFREITEDVRNQIATVTAPKEVRMVFAAQPTGPEPEKPQPAFRHDENSVRSLGLI